MTWIICVPSIQMQFAFKNLHFVSSYLLFSRTLSVVNIEQAHFKMCFTVYSMYRNILDIMTSFTILQHLSEVQSWENVRLCTSFISSTGYKIWFASCFFLDSCFVYSLQTNNVSLASRYGLYLSNVCLIFVLWNCNHLELRNWCPNRNFIVFNRWYLS